MTGDVVQGFQPRSGQRVTERVTVRADGNFYMLNEGKRFNFAAKNIAFLQRADGWLYQLSSLNTTT